MATKRCQQADRTLIRSPPAADDPEGTDASFVFIERLHLRMLEGRPWRDRSRSPERFGMAITDAEGRGTETELEERSSAEPSPSSTDAVDTVIISDDGGMAASTDADADPAKTAPVRVCRKCSTQSQTSGEFCPHCGAGFARRGIGKRGRILVGGLIVALLAVGGATGVALKINHDNQVKAAKHRRVVAAHNAALAAQAAQRARAARQAAQLAAQTAEDQLQVDERKVLVTALQNSITKDAQKDINNGVLNGPAITNTVCTPVGGGNLQDTLADHTGDWSCLAVNQTSADGTESGYGFSATINYDTGSYTWQLGNN